MSRSIPSHRVEIVDEDHEDRPRFREKSPPQASMTERDRERERERERERNRERSYNDRPYHEYHHGHHDYYRMPPPYGYPPHMYHPYYGPPMMYHNQQQQNPGYGHQPQWDPQSNGQIQPHTQNNPAQQNGTSNSMPPQSQNQNGFPMMHPQFLAVNVKTDTHQNQSQEQNQKAENKQITIKEKVIHNVTKGLEGLFDMKVLAVGAGTLVLQHFVRQARENARKGKKKGIALSLGLM